MVENLLRTEDKVDLFTTIPASSNFPTRLQFLIPSTVELGREEDEGHKMCSLVPFEMCLSYPHG